MKFDVRNRYTGEVKFTADIDCTEGTPTSIKLGLAIRWAVASKADLSRAYLREANLSGAYLREANLSEANLSGADLSGAKSIISFGPIGRERRIGYAVKHRDGLKVKLGCFWGTLDEAAAKIRAKYGENSAYENLVRAACAALD